jgi:transporter family protein
MTSWVSWSILALVVWGIWGFLPKLATKYMTTQSIIIYEALGGLCVGLVCLYFAGMRPETHPKGILYASLTGILGMMGGFFYLLAVARGKVSVVVTMTALYPIITIGLAALLLREPITLKQGVGMVLAVVSIILLSAP